MKSVRLGLLLLGCVLFFKGVARQDQNCGQRLQQAQSMFDLGNLPAVPELLLPCINNGYTPEENVRAHKLIALVYLYLDDIAKADDWVVQLLKADPEHKLDSIADPKEIFYHYAKFRTKPIFRIRVAAGANATFVKSLTAYGVENTTEGDPSEYKPNIGINIQVEIERRIYEGLEAGLGLSYTTRSWNISRLLSEYDSTNLIIADESHTWIEAPVSLRYTRYSEGMLSPYAFAGASFSYLLAASLNGARKTNFSIGDGDLMAQNLRTPFTLFAFGGLGAKLRIAKTHFLMFDIRYMNGLQNLVIDDNRYNASSDLYFRGGYVDSNFGINNVMATFGYQHSFYSPKKLKGR